MFLKRDLLPVAKSCGHEQMLAQQLKRIQELADTLRALNDKLECASNSNTKLEQQLRTQEARCREYAVNSAKLLADFEAQEIALDKAQARVVQLSEENKSLQTELDAHIKNVDGLSGWALSSTERIGNVS